MTGVLGLRTRAAWRRRWPSLLAIALLVAVTVTVTLTAVAGARRSNSAPARFLREDGTGDISVGLQPLDSMRGVEEISSLPQVRDVSVNAGMAALPYSEAGDYLPVLAPVDGTGGAKVLRGLLVAGGRPNPRATNEI